MQRIVLRHSYEDIISMDNLLLSWEEFIKGKRARADVQVFERYLMDNLFNLHGALVTMSYKHGSYESFVISDPKTRHIHKALVCDRILHRAIYRHIYHFFDRIFIHDSYSCRSGKGLHKALNQFTFYARKASNNHHKTVLVLKCDIRKFFASIDQFILLAILGDRIVDKRVVWLLEQVIRSFSTVNPNVGLPLGNLTSQVFSNIYLNELDQFVKHRLRVKHYIRYADDFVIFSQNRELLTQLLTEIQDFLLRMLKLELHPNKVEIRTVASGIDFLGWVHFTDHCVLRTTSKRRMTRHLQTNPSQATIASYRGLLSHGNTDRILRIVDKDKF
ncbi:hypothetical protein COV03_01875 [Candidatus Uhrbacteria bacterium CG10_big_fil_rev_8_21_14_0_10_41_26]|nr:MAG: hypothetical protein COY24_02605 [Candidatus Uhrbacteria bacterium CG_4_10_14_0_2_um_filter_41_21]PJB84485.1 MAG: hypothetical protein CO086_03255 [Candidatus Uhrbacteria bacterium CG_4_9_14_0_8_um_filter_41_16]PJE75086.1 MAG: hypothetical protein COV03_01875 [Candidatus Uhrbacteria bacterium CG10_big_fil_rev_8_21_14_0_10_41_26]